MYLREEEVLRESGAFRATSKAQMPKNTGTGSWFKLLQTAGSSLYTQQGQGTRLGGHLQLDYPKLSIVRSLFSNEAGKVQTKKHHTLDEPPSQQEDLIQNLPTGESERCDQAFIFILILFVYLFLWQCMHVCEHENTYS